MNASTRAAWVWLAVALASGVWLVWSMFALDPPLALDEHASFWMHQAGFPQPFLNRTLDVAAVPPGSGLLEWLSLQAFGKSAFALRLPTALCYLAAIATMFAFGQRTGRPAWGGLAAVLLAWHVDVVDEVRIARAYGLLLWLAVLFTWLTFEFFERPDRIRLAVFWGLCGTALLWTHYTALVLIGPATGLVALSVLRSSQRMRAMTALLIGLGVMGSLSLPLLPAILRVREWSTFLNFGNLVATAWSALGPWSYRGVGCAAVLALATLLVTRRSPVRREIVLLATLSFLPLLAAWLLHGEATPLANPRYRVALAPASAALVACLLSQLKAEWLRFAAVSAVLLAVWFPQTQRPWQLVRLADPASPEWQAAALQLDPLIAPDEPVFVQSGLVESSLMPVKYVDAQFSEYVACRLSPFHASRPGRRIGLPFFWNTSREMREHYQQCFQSNGQPLPRAWLLSATDTDLNQQSADGLLQLAGEAGYRPTLIGDWANVKLWRLDRIAN